MNLLRYSIILSLALVLVSLRLPVVHALAGYHHKRGHASPRKDVLRYVITPPLPSPVHLNNEEGSPLYPYFGDTPNVRDRPNDENDAGVQRSVEPARRHSPSASKFSTNPASPEPPQPVQKKGCCSGQPLSGLSCPCKPTTCKKCRCKKVRCKKVKTCPCRKPKCKKPKCKKPCCSTNFCSVSTSATAQPCGSSCGAGASSCGAGSRCQPNKSPLFYSVASPTCSCMFGSINVPPGCGGCQKPPVVCGAKTPQSCPLARKAEGSVDNRGVEKLLMNYRTPTRSGTAGIQPASVVGNSVSDYAHNVRRNPENVPPNLGLDKYGSLDNLQKKYPFQEYQPSQNSNRAPLAGVPKVQKGGGISETGHLYAELHPSKGTSRVGKTNYAGPASVDGMKDCQGGEYKQRANLASMQRSNQPNAEKKEIGAMDKKAVTHMSVQPLLAMSVSPCRADRCRRRKRLKKAKTVLYGRHGSWRRRSNGA